jgi:hypothetical protein
MTKQGLISPIAIQRLPGQGARHFAISGDYSGKSVATNKTCLSIAKKIFVIVGWCKNYLATRKKQ